MARIVEDIDNDELPELEDLVKNLKAGIRKEKRGDGVLIKPHGRLDRVTGMGNRMGKGRGIDGTKKIEEECGVREVERGANGTEVRRKKRVLIRKSDNPLLRPLNATSRTSSSELVSKVSRSVRSVSKDGNSIPRLGEDLSEETRKQASRDSRSVSGGKAGNVVPAKGPPSLEKKKDHSGSICGEKARDARHLKEPAAPGQRAAHSRFVSGAKTRDVTLLEKPAASEQKVAANNSPRKFMEPKQTKGRKLESMSVFEEHYDSDGLSDFVVDSTFLEEEDSVVEMPPPPPRSTRKLVQGRKPKKEVEFDDDDLDLELQKLSIKDDVPKRAARERSKEQEFKDFAEDFSDDDVPATMSVPRKLFEQIKMEPPRRTKEASAKKKVEAPSSDIEDPFTLSYSPSESKPRKVFKKTRFSTSPRSPEPVPRRFQSPTKKFQRIPATPHRESTDAFWQPDIINEWNDEYSPRKTPKPKAKPFSDEDSSKDMQSSPKKCPVKPDRAAKEAKKAFSERKNAIAEAFLAELDTKITNGQISKLAASTGGVQIIWSKKLNTTAGRANWRRETVKSSYNHPQPPTQRHHAAIELAEKVIDAEDRLLNVIAHEFCHLANFMISNIKTNPHGKEFKAWASKVSERFKHRGIEVTTKHSYVIDYKYVWECESCGLQYKRHSKSIDPKRHSCGACKSRLVQIKPVPRGEGKGDGKGGDWEKKVNEYQTFVKENMGKVREENPGSPQKLIMVEVGRRYQEYKASKLKNGKTTETVVVVDEIDNEELEGTPEEDVWVVARKLDCLDLTSP